MAKFGFLKDFEKEIKGLKSVGGDVEIGRYWISLGNYVLNRVMSGEFTKGIAQGTGFLVAGFSGTGKSFIAGNAIREAQAAGAFNLIIDSENALDEEYLTKIGVKYDDSILRKRVVKITDTWSLIRAFLDGYIEEYGDDLPNAPKVHITIDSLGFLVTDSDYDNANDGTYKADQGASKRMIKDLLKKLTHAVAGMNITYLCTDQVYQARAEQIMAGTAINGAVLNEQVKFAFHQIAYLSRLKLKDDKTKEITGIRLKIAAAKTRYTKPFGQIELEVPYDTGIDPFNGLLEVAVALGVVEKKGSRFSIAGEDKTWYSKDFNDYANDVLIKCEMLKDASIFVDTGLEQEKVEKPVAFEKQKRLAGALLEDLEVDAD
jgi:RecA/RadA recombinase